MTSTDQVLSSLEEILDGMSADDLHNVLDIVPADALTLSDCYTVASRFYKIFQQNKVVSHLLVATTYWQYALQATLKDVTLSNMARADILQCLGAAYSEKFRILRDTMDLNIAIRFHYKALFAASINYPNRVEIFQNLGIGYWYKYQKTKAMSDLNTTIQIFENALDIAVEINSATQLLNLGDKYYERYERLEAVVDIDMAIQLYQKASTAPMEGDFNETGLFFKIGLGHYKRCIRIGNVADLDIALEMFQNVIDATPNDDPNWSDRMASIGMVHLEKYRMRADELSLDKAIVAFEQAFEKASTTSNRANLLQKLGLGYLTKHQKFGNMIDLDTAIDSFQKALQENPNQALELASLGMGYVSRYLKTWAMADLDSAIRLYHNALDVTPKDSPLRAQWLQVLGIGYQYKYERTEEEADLEKAVYYLQISLDTTPDDHAELIWRLWSLGRIYRDKYLKTNAIADLDKSILLLQNALEITPRSHPRRPDRLQSLAIGYIGKYEWSGNIDDLNLSIQLFQDALNITPYDHTDRAFRLQGIGLAYYNRYKETGVTGDLDMAIQRLQEASEHSPSSLLIRLKSAIYLIAILARAEKWSLAYSVASKGISLIPLITPRSLENSDKQYLLTDITGFASDAAAIALTVGKPPLRAIQLLEIGRGVILSSSYDLRADISEFKRTHPQLAEQYMKLRQELDTSMTSIDLSNPLLMTGQRNRRYDAEKRIEQIIQDIRKLPGLDQFLLGPSENELRNSASTGPIVMVNMSDYRCDAFLIEKHAIRTIRLPNLYAGDIRNRVKFLKPGLVDVQLLEWLWETIAKPILGALGFCEPPRDVWPRIWWILTGTLAKFPIHAAGYHLSRFDTVLDRAISSYSSSIRSLIQGQKISRLRATPKFDIVLVGTQDLPFAPREIQELKQLFDSMNLKICKPETDRKNVLAALTKCDIFHFAGHGQTDLYNPFKSALLLDNDKITVKDFFEQNIQSRKPFLAYLSACGTGQVAYNALIDESLHLIAACQLTGFQHVIGTLWEVNDESCVGVAKDTYAHIKYRNMCDGSVSEGLHHACRKLRGQWVSGIRVRVAVKRDKEIQDIHETPPTNQLHSNSSQERGTRDVVPCDDIPLYWVPYVHFGL